MSTTPWAHLEGHKYISFESFKRNGDGVKTPVWFVRQGDRLLFMTARSAWKVKRLRHNDRCRVAACNATGGKILGPWREGLCVPIADEAVPEAYRLLSGKYLSLKLANPFAKLLGREGERQYYEITAAS